MIQQVNTTLMTNQTYFNFPDVVLSDFDNYWKVNLWFDTVILFTINSLRRIGWLVSN